MSRLASREVIADRVGADHPHDESLRISHEAIYRWVVMDACQGGTLYCHLRRRRKYCQRQKRYGSGRRFIPGRVGIEERPGKVVQRLRLGDWKGDLVLGRKGVGAIATLGERKSWYLMAAPFPDRKANTFNTAAIPIYQGLPKTLCQALTLDNGNEFSQFKDL